MSASMEACIARQAALLSPPLLVPSLPLHFPSPLTTSPIDTRAPLGYRAAGIRMRALLPSTSHRTNIPEADMPPRKKAFLTAFTLRFKIGESFAAGAARQPGPTESDLRRCRVKQAGYGITDTWDEIVDKMIEIAPTTLEGVNERVTDLDTTVRQRTNEFEVRFEDAQFNRALLRARVNTLFRDRLDHRRTTMLMDREAMYSREAWTFSMDRSSAIAGHVRTLETQVVALITQTTSLQTQLTRILGRIEVLEARDPEPQEGPAEAGSSIGGSVSVSATSASKPSASGASASGALASRASTSGTSVIRERVGVLNMDNDPLVDVVVHVDDDDDDDDGNSRAHKINEEVRPKKKAKTSRVTMDDLMKSRQMREAWMTLPSEPDVLKGCIELTGLIMDYNQKLALIIVMFNYLRYGWSRKGKRKRDNNSAMSGRQFTLELLQGNDRQCVELLRMSRDYFIRLCTHFRVKEWLEDSKHVSVEEKWLCFYDVRSQSTGSVGALDGTLIHARVPINKQHLYRGRGKGDCYQHVLAICDFNMMFTFLVAGWKGVGHDSRILLEAIRNQNAPFLLPPPDKYYLCDATYAHTRGFMASYRNVRYWLGDFRRRRPLNDEELRFTPSSSNMVCR
uniref:Uncharacterized protein n=1 Tax=Tanacetum cinerariifolium TaxID=118510 RepID=A0A6L2KR81_TANCI|nr:hypothetical protein [Tanacetum cinerariifolium]